MVTDLLRSFDKIICLCVDHRRNEWGALTRQFEERGLNVEKFVVGKGHIFPANKYDLIDQGEPPATWLPQYTKNAYYCHMSHRKILEKAQRAGLESILLLEDDCELSEGFDGVVRQATQQLINLQVKWDTLTFGQNLVWGQADQASPNLLKLRSNVFCWHAIVINQKYNDMFSHFLSLPVEGPFDYLWSKYTQPKCNCYGIWPSVAVQRSGISYVENRYCDYTHWMKEKGNNEII